MDIGKSLTFFTEDERWLEKLAIGTGVVLISLVLSPVLIGVIGFLIVAGYCVRLLKNVRDGAAQPLPEWDQWGDDLIRGFKLAVVAFVWALPGIVFALPLAIGGAMTDGQSDTAATFGGLLVACGGCLTFLYGLAVAVLMPGFTIAYAQDEEIKSGLQATQIWHWTRQNIGQVVIVTVAYLVGSLVLTLVGSIVGTIACLIGLVVTIPLATLATSLFRFHLYGQLAHEFPMTGSGLGVTTVATFPNVPMENPPDSI
ncbi:MAG: DUF4013 domain-containing protein [Chloroflexota bacterium]|nr:DUF4013 domain-containing protein [Chloroflexota bacterium]